MKEIVFEKEVQTIVARMEVTIGNFVLSRGTEVQMVVHKFPVEKVSLLFQITKKVKGNVLVERDDVSRNFEVK